MVFHKFFQDPVEEMESISVIKPDFASDFKNAPDKLDVLKKYERWFNAQPDHVRRSNADDVLEDIVNLATSHDSAVPGLCNNDKFVSICYAILDYCSSDGGYEVMQRKRIATKTASFFSRWSAILVSEGNYAKAFEVCRNGVYLNAEPRESLLTEAQRVYVKLREGNDSLPRKMPNFAKMFYNERHSSSIEERLATLHYYRTIHGRTIGSARRIVEVMPPDIYALYFHRLYSLGYKEHGIQDLPPHAVMHVPPDVGDGDGPQMSLEEWLMKRRMTTERINGSIVVTREEPSILSCTNMELPSMNFSRGGDFSLFAPPMPDDVTFNVTAPVAPKMKFEETTVFTRAARKEMSGFWYHDPDPEESITRKESFADFEATLPPSRCSKTDEIVKPFDVFEDSSALRKMDISPTPSSGRKHPSPDENSGKIISDAAPFSVFEDSSCLSKPASANVFRIHEDEPTKTRDLKFEPPITAPLRGENDPAYSSSGGSKINPSSTRKSIFQAPVAKKENVPPMLKAVPSELIKNSEDYTVSGISQGYQPAQEEFTLRYLLEPSQFSALARKEQLQSTPCEKRGSRKTEDQSFVPLRLKTKTPCRASIMPALMSPLVECSRESYQSSSSGSKSTWKLCTTVPDKLQAIAEASTMDGLSPAEFLKEKIIEDPMNDELKFHLAVLSYGEAQLRCLENLNASWKDLSMGSSIKLCDGELHSICIIWDMNSFCQRDTNAVVLVTSGNNAAKFVKLMEPLSSWEVFCWLQLARRTNRVPPRGVVLDADSYALVEIRDCSSTNWNSLINLIGFYKVRNELLPVEIILRVLLVLVRMVNELHDCGLVIGYIAPENILISDIILDDSAPWDEKIFIGDLTSAVDLMEFPEDGVKFCWSRPEANDVFLLGTTPHEVDHIGIVKMLACMLFPEKEFKIWVEQDRRVAYYNLSRKYKFRSLWQTAADLLLNPESHQNPLPVLQEVILCGKEIQVIPEASPQQMNGDNVKRGFSKQG
ncbi:unnamed protein product, partial [Notodromas monacha]